MIQSNLEKKQIDLIRESICVYTTSMDCRALFKDGLLCFENIEDFVDDRGQSCLFRLKEMCHGLFRNSDEATYKEKLYDITVGYIFHEAMKLREDLYQLEYSRKWDVNTQELTVVEKKIVREIDAIVHKAEKRLRGGFKEVKILLAELLTQLKDLIVIYKGNYLMPRFILENEKVLVRIYGKKGFGQLLNDMYHDGRLLLLHKAAVSYLESEYYDLARPLFQKMYRVAPENETVLFLYLFTSAYYFYFKSMFKKALFFAERAGAAGTNLHAMRPYGEQLASLVAELNREIGRRKR